MIPRTIIGFLIIFLIFTNSEITSQSFLSDEMQIKSDVVSLMDKIKENKGLKGIASFVCDSCKRIINITQKSTIIVQEIVMDFIVKQICIYYKIEAQEVCEGAVNEMIPSIISSFNKHFLDPDIVCPLFSLCPKVYENIDIDALLEEIKNDKPKIIPEFFQKSKIPTGRKTLKVLQVADVHSDKEYLEGARTSCEFPICCREESGMANGQSPAAGKWGSLATCDLPYVTINAFVKQIKNQFNIDFALWTGDNTSHDIWHQTQERNLENTKTITDLFKENFNFTVYPIMGNHESYPVNVYDYHSEREQELNSELANYWEHWIGADAAKQHKKFAFYSTYNEKLNLRVIGLNTQACNDENWYLIRNPTDPGNMLDWLRQELLNAEQNLQHVFILSHIPPRDCLETYETIFDAIINRFSHVIKGQFTGHTHRDGYQVFRDSDTNKIQNVLFLGGSLTTFSYRLPTFRIIEVDEDSMLPVNYQTYLLNITKWNEISVMDPNVTAEFEFAFDFLKQFNLTDMSYESMEGLTERLRTDPETIRIADCNAASFCSPLTPQSSPANINVEYYCDTISTAKLRLAMCTEAESYEKWVVRLITGKWRKQIE